MLLPASIIGEDHFCVLAAQPVSAVDRARLLVAVVTRQNVRVTSCRAAED